MTQPVITFERMLLELKDYDSLELRHAAQDLLESDEVLNDAACAALDLPAGSTVGEAAAEVLEYQAEAYPDVVKQWELEPTEA